MSAQIVLASRSPRRTELLTLLGLRHVVIAADVPEHPEAGQSPANYAIVTAVAKAREGVKLAALHLPEQSGLPVLGADTDVAIDGEILGKPRDSADAIAMLGRLSGRVHQVVSAVAVIQGDRCETVLTCTDVTFGQIDRDDAAAYAASGAPLDKAGAYGIQGHAARWVRRIEGSYTGIVGLPLLETAELLARFGVRPEALSANPDRGLKAANTDHLGHWGADAVRGVP